MSIRPYAQRPARLALQLFADTCVLVWIVLWSWVAKVVHDAVLTIASVTFTLRDGAGGVAQHLDDAGNGVRKVPLIGDPVAGPLSSAGAAAGQVADAGQRLGDTVTSTALPIALALLVGTVLPIAGPWLALRWRYARRAGALADLARSAPGVRLLALRALANQPARRLIAMDADPVAAWDRGDPRVTTALAELELRRAGLVGRRWLAQAAAVEPVDDPVS
jgi:hypothetical protein